MPTRPPFIVATEDVPPHVGHYPDSDETFGVGRAIGRAAGLRAIGLHVEELRPGERTSYPHAESDEEEFVFVLEGSCDAWIDGHLHPIQEGDLAAFPSGTGICHTFLNNGDTTCRLLVGGERSKRDNCTRYPLNPERRAQMIAQQGSATNSRGQSWMWDDAPVHPLGPHDGRPRRR